MEINISIRELYWLAGLLEGEGSFMKGPPSAPKRPRISLSMTDEDIVAKAASLFGCNYAKVASKRYARNGWKTPYRVIVRGKRAVEFMKLLRPLMGTRRQQQIDKAIKSYDDSDGYRRSGKTRAALTEPEIIDVKQRLENGESQRSIADDLDIGRHVIADISAERTWKHIIL